MDLNTLFTALQRSPSLLSISVVQFTKFFALCRLGQPTLEAAQHLALDHAPPLPNSLLSIFSNVLCLSESIVDGIWDALRHEIWSTLPKGQPSDTFSATEIAEFNKYALPLQTSFKHLYPPVRCCTNQDCTRFRPSQDGPATLSDPRTHKASLFTLSHGALPVFTTSFYCRGCRRRYYHNYFVERDCKVRVYYRGIQSVLQVALHYFIESRLLEVFATGQVFGWLSSQNCARIYNLSLGKTNAYIQNNPAAFTFGAVRSSSRSSSSFWDISLYLRDEDALNGFFLYSLLLDCAERGHSLILPHGEAQRDRLRWALARRNKLMEGVGQEEYLHACDLCFAIVADPTVPGGYRKVQAAVCDGVTLGHPCCAYHNCKIPLMSQRDRYCPQHLYLLNHCAVKGCGSRNSDGFRTCSNPGHRQVETAYFAKGKAMFQLRSRLKNLGLPSTVINDPAAVAPPVMDEEEEVTAEDCGEKPLTGNRTYRAAFGCKRTHNEQLIERSCGVILSRTTFYGSEAVSGVLKYAKATFPTPASVPDFFIFDNNCKLLAHMRAIGDTHFSKTKTPVDVFHFKAKHKGTDVFCQQNCNPAAFKDLIVDGKWRFNTSICEQTNVWLDGFQPIIRNMEVTRYNFFLDEMIKRKNRWVVGELE
ncbi:hypothetical protein BKA70DRAFT_1460642 [Coprinopsis sp. MPI-PUGE-AT-0042]|nr:hypothetical protein BKA70DRAFT_1460642 [Coprinopsis sp. MPI-PUGE-AT-0042]